MAEYNKPNFLEPVPSDIVISKSTLAAPITLVAKNCGIQENELEPYGSSKAKVKLSKRLLAEQKVEDQGNYICVTGINPTKHGEGKSTTLVGLSQALGLLGDKVFTCIRQPSMGPTFGIKGGAAGGGYSQVIPMEEFNLHLTGDIHAVGLANNLIAAAIDTRIFHEKTQKDGPLFRRLTKTHAMFSKIQIKRLEKLGIKERDPKKFTPEEKRLFARLDFDEATITWRRVVDVNDRLVREIEIGLQETKGDPKRKTGFDISVASEIMAILALASSLTDMKERIGRMVLGLSKAGVPITCDDLGVTDAATILMKDAIKPTLMQTLEGTPVFVHAGPFANIAHGNSSIIADKIALNLVGKAGYVLTEAGFGSDIGMEKFCNIKSRYSGLTPTCMVLVTTIRAMKSHGGKETAKNPETKQPWTEEEELNFLKKGVCNMQHHVKNAIQFGVPVVVALNQFTLDTEKEISISLKAANDAGAFDAVLSNHWAKGGKGADALAKSVKKACAWQRTESKEKFHFLYPLDLSIKDKINKIVTDVYGGGNVEYSEVASQKIASYTKNGFGNLPICMAKTHMSLSADPKLKGAPKGFTINISDVRASVGAGFVFPLVGSIRTMPGLPTRPAYYDMEIDTETGSISGLF